MPCGRGGGNARFDLWVCKGFRAACRRWAPRWRSIGTATGQHQLAYTDETGHFSLNGLLPGSYDLRASAPSFLPTLREDVALSAGAAKVLNITLNTLFEAIKMLPPAKRTGQRRRYLEVDAALHREPAHPALRRRRTGGGRIGRSRRKSFSGGLAFVAGGTSAGYGSGSDLGTAFNLEHSIFSGSTLGFNGTLGYGTGIPDGILQLSYQRQSDEPGMGPQMALSIRRFAAPQNGVHLGSLQALSFSYSNGFSIGELLDVRRGQRSAGHPVHGPRQRRAALRLAGRASDAEHRAGVQVHHQRTEPGGGRALDGGPGEIAQGGPRMSLYNNDPLLENAHHHELSLSQRFGDDNSLQVAYYRDRVNDPELLGVGEIDSDDTAISCPTCIPGPSALPAASYKRRACAWSTSASWATRWWPPSTTATAAFLSWISPVSTGRWYTTTSSRRGGTRRP